MRMKPVSIFALYLGLLSLVACSNRDETPSVPAGPAVPASQEESPAPPPVQLHSGRGQFRHIDVLAFTRNLSSVPAGERTQIEAWLADRVDLNEGDPGVKLINPAVKLFLYQDDMQASATHPDMPSNEGAYLHFSETTVIQYRDLAGRDVGSPVTFPGSPPGDPASPASRVKLFMWDEERYAFYVADPGYRAWQTDNILSDMGTTYDGTFLDEHNPGFRRGLYLGQNQILSGGGIREFDGLRPSEANLPGKNYNALDARYSEAAVAWMTALRGSLQSAGKFLFINPAQYYWMDIAENEYLAAGGVCMELVHVPWDWTASSYESCTAQIRRAVAAGAMVDLFGRWCEGMRATFNRGNYATALDRYRMWRLASYYYVRGYPDDPGIVYFDPSFCYQNDTFAEYVAEWAPANEVDIGDPLADGYVIQQGSTSCGSYKVFARDYTHAMVLVRPQDGYNCGDFGDGTAFTINLPRAMRILTAAGALTSPVTSVQLRNAEALVLVHDLGGDTGVP